MVDIRCTRCNATGTGYATNYVAKFSLVHERGCGARIGIPTYTDTSVAAKIETPITKVESVVHDTDHSEQLLLHVVKTKKKKTSKKK